MAEKLNNSKRFCISFKVARNVKKDIWGDTIEELIDNLALLKDAGFINYFIRLFEDLTEEQLARLDDIILTTDNAEQIVRYVRKRQSKINTEKFQDKLMELKNVTQLVKFTILAINPDIKKTEDAVIHYGNAQNAVDLLKEVPGVNQERMKDFILKRKEAETVCYLVEILIRKNKTVNQKDYLKAKQIVINSKDMWAIRYWAVMIGDVTEMENVTIQYGDGWTLYHFAKYVKRANIEKIRKAMEQREDIDKIVKEEFNLEFNLEFPKSSIF